ncbi:MAG: calcium-binding protein [Paracoccaceae bacterium]
MATIRFTSTEREPALDMFSYQSGLAEFLFSYTNASANTTSFRFFNSASDSTTFSGTGFVYDFVQGEVDGARAGTITSVTTVFGGQTTLSVMGLSVSANTFSDFLNAGRSRDAFNLFIAGNDAIFGGTQGDSLIGGRNNDTLRGGAGEDLLFGGTENDMLYGGADNDRMAGGSGNDTFFGGLGRDTMNGDAGRDAFVFNTALISTQRDRITDFVAADDVIRLENAVFKAFATLGTIQQSQFYVGVAAQDAQDRIIYDRAEGVLSYDRDGTGAAQAVVFALVNPGTALGYLDIVII